MGRLHRAVTAFGAVVVIAVGSGPRAQAQTAVRAESQTVRLLRGSITGTVLAAFILGIAESFVSTFAGPSWAPAVAFGILLVTLAVRPSGILGRAS